MSKHQTSMSVCACVCVCVWGGGEAGNKIPSFGRLTERKRITDNEFICDFGAQNLIEKAK
jgi:hypothetical protein